MSIEIVTVEDGPFVHYYAKSVEDFIYQTDNQEYLAVATNLPQDTRNGQVYLHVQKSYYMAHKYLPSMWVDPEVVYEIVQRLAEFAVSEWRAYTNANELLEDSF